MSPFIDPVQPGETLRGLEVVRGEGVLQQGDGEPDQVGAEEEELPCGKGNPPSWRCHRSFLASQRE